MKETLKTVNWHFFKIAATTVALFFVFKKIPFSEIFEIIKETSLFFLVLGLFCFNASKVISSFRLGTFYQTISISISKLTNLKLYYLGMFYNLFLPGGIGGDGYKIYLLKQNKSGSTKQLIAATLMDRLSGLAALSFLLGIISFYSEIGNFRYFRWAGFFLIIASFLTLWIIGHVFFPYLKKAFLNTSVQSLGVQVAQLICSFFLLIALGVKAHYFEYLLLFLVSSAVSVLPFTIGGVGARELVFLYGYEFLPIEATTALAFSLLFFAITALSSLIGLVFIKGIDEKLKKE